jgi:hypothetical protein
MHPCIRGTGFGAKPASLGREPPVR